MARHPSRFVRGAAARSCLAIAGVVAFVLVLIVGFAIMRYRARHADERAANGEAPTSTTPAPSAPAGAGLPDLPTKPTPHLVDFQECPPIGDGSDRDLNKLKNRDDDASQYYPVAFDAVEKLPFPTTIERLQRVKWSASDKAAIAKYEGTPVAIEGYLADAKEEGPEACNCHGADTQYHDFHIWMTKNAHEDRTAAIVVEATPRTRATHPSWTVSALRRLAKDGTRVRVSGWLLMDPEHPDQIGKTRGTIWEVHPIMRIEQQVGGQWRPL
jgi:hypothetical protein